MNRKTALQLATLPFFVLLAMGSSSPKKDGAAVDDKAASTTTLTASKLGKPVTIGEAEWTVVEIVNRGTTMKANSSYEDDASTTGSFVQVRFKVLNKGKKEGTLAEVPKLVDASGREFGTIENGYSFRPKDTENVSFEKVQPSMSREFVEIYELPAGVTTVSLKAHDFGMFGDDKAIELGTLPAAAPAPAAAAAPGSAAKAQRAAVPAAAKAKSAPAKK